MKYMAFILLFFAHASAADFTATLAIPQATATLFDKISLQLVLSYPKGYQVDLAQLQNNLLQSGGFGIAPFRIEHVSHELKEDGATVQETLTFVLVPQTLGKKTLTFWKIPFKVPHGETGPHLYSNWVEVEILAPSEKLKKPLIAPLMALTEVFPRNLTAENRYLLAELEQQEPSRNQKIFAQRSFAWLGWLALALGALFLWRFRKPKEKNLQEEERQLARKQLKQSLSALQEDIKSGNLENFYTHLAAHLRLFYEQFYGQRIKALTTEEFLKEASPAMRQTFQEILFVGDQVRFGHLPSTQENAQKALDIALKQLTFSE